MGPLEAGELLHWHQWAKWPQPGRKATLSSLILYQGEDWMAEGPRGTAEAQGGLAAGTGVSAISMLHGSNSANSRAA